jgi:hypothetical protein
MLLLPIRFQSAKYLSISLTEGDMPLSPLLGFIEYRPIKSYCTTEVEQVIYLELTLGVYYVFKVLPHLY